MYLGFKQQMQSLDENYTLEGMPIIGFAVQKYTNQNAAPGLLAQYSGVFKHKYKRSVETNSEAEEPVKSGMMISNDNQGQVLLFPYYSVRNSITTLLSIVNTTDRVKALKLSFHEGKNSRVTLEFNLYLSAYDVWTTALNPITSTAVSVGQDFAGQNSVILHTADTLCTVPAINGQEFLPFAFTAAFDDGQGADLDRVREGWLAVYEMGELINQDAVASTHSNGVPVNCSNLVGNWVPPSGKLIVDPTDNVVAPDGTGGLYGSMSLVDVAEGFDISYDATALVGWNSNILHTSPSELTPNLSSGSAEQTLIKVNNEIIQTTWNSPIEAVTALFMQSQVSNDFAIDSGIQAQTEWVNHFITKEFYVDPLISGSETPLAPFNKNISAAMGSCEYHRFRAFNREQTLNSVINIPSVPNPLPPGISLYPEDCWSIVVSDVNRGENTSSLFESQIQVNDSLLEDIYSSVNAMPFSNGWMQMDFYNQVENPGSLVG